MFSNVNIKLQFPHRDIGAGPEYCILYEVLYILKTFASLAIKFLTIQPIIPFAFNTTEKI